MTEVTGVSVIYPLHIYTHFTKTYLLEMLTDSQLTEEFHIMKPKFCVMVRIQTSSVQFTTSYFFSMSRSLEICTTFFLYKYFVHNIQVSIYDVTLECCITNEDIESRPLKSVCQQLVLGLKHTMFFWKASFSYYSQIRGHELI
jgi:hypothetical protein